VSGLAHCIHDSDVLHRAFDDMVQKNDTLQGFKHMLDRHVATHWNSDFTCLSSHLLFQREIQQITAITEYKLKAYCLSDRQWDMVENLVDVLNIFKEATDLFSQDKVPLIMETLPIFHDLKLSLECLSDEVPKLPAVMRVATHASLLVLEKYMTLTRESEIYYITTGVKLEWFKVHGYTTQQVQDITNIVIKRWETSY
ncbi:hypothetical protein BDQ17DRAFT_1178072, partial [Cyathus striatus]